jgi:hypothetical protein
MSKSTSTSNKKKKVELNGRNYRWGDLYDSWNIHQQADFDGTGIDVNSPIPQDNGEPLPSLADQWKEDYKRRMKNVKSSGNR